MVVRRALVGTLAGGEHTLRAPVNPPTAPTTPRQVVSGALVGTLFSQEEADNLEAEEAEAEAAGVAARAASAAEDRTARGAALKARAASRVLQALPSARREAVLAAVADALLAAEGEIMAANAEDVAAAAAGPKKIADSLMQRLKLKSDKIEQLADGIRSIAHQDEPVGRLLGRTELAEGLVLDKVCACPPCSCRCNPAPVSIFGACACLCVCDSLVWRGALYGWLQA